MITDVADAMKVQIPANVYKYTTLTETRLMIMLKT
jgi:hypothetical protein